MKLCHRLQQEFQSSLVKNIDVLTNLNIEVWVPHHMKLSESTIRISHCVFEDLNAYSGYIVEEDFGRWSISKGGMEISRHEVNHWRRCICMRRGW